MKIICVSGPQGGGKSTYLQALEDDAKGKSGVSFDKFKVSRHVQEKLGWENLTRVYDSYESMKEFQLAVFQAKQENDSKYIGDSSGIVFSERGFLDILAYFELWASKFYQAGDITEAVFKEDLSDFANRCLTAQKMYHTVVFIPFMDHMQFEHDPKRGFEQDIERYSSILEKWLTMSTNGDGKSNVFYMTEKTVQGRVNSTKHLLD